MISYNAICSEYHFKYEQVQSSKRDRYSAPFLTFETPWNQLQRHQLARETEASPSGFAHRMKNLCRYDNEQFYVIFYWMLPSTTRWLCIIYVFYIIDFLSLKIVISYWKIFPFLNSITNFFDFFVLLSCCLIRPTNFKKFKTKTIS